MSNLSDIIEDRMRENANKPMYEEETVNSLVNIIYRLKDERDAYIIKIQALGETIDKLRGANN